MSELKTRLCGAVHPDGVVCVIPIYYEKQCCVEKLYQHTEPHEHVDANGVVTHRWEELRVIENLPYDAYTPRVAKPELKAV